MEDTLLCSLPQAAQAGRVTDGSAQAIPGREEKKQCILPACLSPPWQMLKNSDGESESFAEGSVIIPGNKSFPAPLSPAPASAPSPPKENQASLPASQRGGGRAGAGRLTQSSQDGCTHTTANRPQASQSAGPVSGTWVRPAGWMAERAVFRKKGSTRGSAECCEGKCSHCSPRSACRSRLYSSVQAFPTRP